MKDFHIHPPYSMDARGDMKAFVKNAIDKGLDEICFTTHIDLNPAREIIDRWLRPNGVMIRLSDELINQYLEDVKSLDRKFNGKIKVNAGFEFSYAKHYEGIIDDFLKKYPVDFTIGSVHCIGNAGFTAGFEVNTMLFSHTPFKFMEKYAKTLIDLTKSGLFSSIGHIDGYKKYASRRWNMKNMREAEDKFFPKIFKNMVEKDMGFELNTSAIRKGHDEFYPSEKLLKMAKDYGLRIASIGSDAHRPAQVGFMIEEGYNLLDKIGIDREF